METNAELLLEVRSQLIAQKGFKKKLIIGLDGFVDEIVHVVDKRQNFNSFERVNKIEALGNRITKAAGLSTNMELVTAQTKLGGNGPILSNALLEYGVNLTYIGALGNNDIHEVFKPMAEKCDAVYQLCDPGHSDALEFDDGKIIFGKLISLNEITWQRVKDVVGGVEKIAELVLDCDLFGMENWTMVPHMSEVWEGMITEVFPLLPDKDEKPLAFFDLADPEKRTIEDISNAMKLIGQFESKYRAILGLNEKELFEIADVFEVDYKHVDDSQRLEFCTKAVYDKLGIYCLVVHPTKEASCVVNGEYFNAKGPYCAKPVLTTGAGDNFNAGFCLGQVLGLSPLASLVVGVSTSGFYVRNAKSPTLANAIDFLEQWSNGELK